MMQRAKYFAAENYYLSPTDGHLAKLFVQSTQEVYDADPNSTWRRTFIRNRSPLILQIANWVLTSLPAGDREAKGEEIAIAAGKWVPSCVAILFLVSFSHHMDHDRLLTDAILDDLPGVSGGRSA